MPRPDRGAGLQRAGALLLALALLAFSLSGCTSKKDKPFTGQLTVWVGPPPGTVDAAGNLPAGDAQSGPLGPIYRAASAFEQAHPGIKVKVAPFDWPELNGRLAEALAGSDWAQEVPDVAAVSAQVRPNPAWLAKGALESASALLPTDETKDDWPFALDAFRDRGNLYGFPAWTTVQALYLNLALFEERGVTPPTGGQWTFDEFARDAARLTFIRADGTTVAGLGVPLRTGYYELWPLLYGGGARPLAPDGKSFTLDQPAGQLALERLVALKSQTGSPWIGTDGVPDLFQAFADPAQRTVAIVPWDSWALDELQRSPTFSATPLKLALARYPSDGATPVPSLAKAGGFVVFKESSASRRDAALALAKALAGAETQQGLAALGALPARSSLAKPDAFSDPLRRQLAAMLPRAELPPRAPGWSKAEPALVGEVSAALTGRKTAAQALADAKKQVDAALTAAATP